MSGFQKPLQDKSTHPSPQRPTKKYDGPIYLPSDIYKMLNQDVINALKKYNSNAIARYQKKRDINVTELAPDEPTSSVQQNSDDPVEGISSDTHEDNTTEDETDPILDYVNSQNHHEDDVNQALQAYHTMTQSYSSSTPQRSVNSAIIVPHYHIAQAQQAKFSSLVDRGANGGLAGSDVRVLATSSRKCTVTGIDQHQIQGLDIVQCAALVQSNHGLVNVILNEYAYYGKGHTIHSPGQIEWHKNMVNDKSVKVGGAQRICTLDGYSFPLICRGGLMYLNLIGKPTDDDLKTYPSVHLTSIHEWDPTVLDYSHPEESSNPSWADNSEDRDLFDPDFDIFGDYNHRSINTLITLADFPSATQQKLYQAHKHAIRTDKVEYSQ